MIGCEYIDGLHTYWLSHIDEPHTIFVGHVKYDKHRWLVLLSVKIYELEPWLFSPTKTGPFQRRFTHLTQRHPPLWRQHPPEAMSKLDEVLKVWGHRGAGELCR